MVLNLSKTSTLLLSTIMLCCMTGISQSCTDEGYAWDDIDKNALFNIPPLMLGSIDTIYLSGLPIEVLPGDISTPQTKTVLNEVITGVFEGDAVENFFFDGAGTVEFAMTVDVAIDIDITQDDCIELYFYVTNDEDQRIEEILIPVQKLYAGENQKISVKIDSQYMEYMENAKNLELTIVIFTKDAPAQIKDGDYIFLKDVIVKTGGYHFEI